LKYFLNPINQSVKQPKPRITKETSEGMASTQKQLSNQELTKFFPQLVLSKVNEKEYQHESRVKAFELYKKAADNGCSIAQYNLGQCYENGKGVEKDEA